MKPGSPATLPAYARLLRDNRNFRLLWFAQIVSEQGDWIYAGAVYSVLLQYTGQARSIGLAFVLQVLPQFFVSPAAGVINDRLPRRQVMIFADLMRAVIVLAMLLARGPGMVWLIYTLLFLETILWALFEPARSAVIPNVATESQLLTANTLSAATWSFNFFMGFSVGGFITAFLGQNTAFVVNAFSFLLSAACLRAMRFSEPHAENRPRLRIADLFNFSPVREGMAYVRANRQLRATIFVKAGQGLMGANWVLLPIFGQRIFPIHVHSQHPGSSATLGMSVLMAARGVGAAMGPLLAGMWARDNRDRMRNGILFGFLLAASGYLALSAAPNLPLACAAVTLAHSGGSILWVFSSTLLQLQTDDQFRGRVFSTEFAFAVVTMSLSSYSAGILIDRGVSPTTVAACVGCVMLFPAALWALALRSGMNGSC